MLLSPSQFADYAQKIADLPAGEPGVAIDLETTGLKVRAGAKAFLIGAAHRGLGNASMLLDESSASLLKLLCSNPRIYYAAQNAKFEMSFLRKQFGVEIIGPVWDTEIFARVCHNKHLGYSLEKCADRIGMKKHEPMMEWLGSKRGNKNKYHEAPIELLVPYVEQDAYLSLVLMEKQLEILRHWNTGTHIPIGSVVKLEMATTKNLFEMEDRGFQLDTGYCRDALSYEEARVYEAHCEFERAADIPFVDSRKTLEPLFKREGLPIGVTEKGAPSFDDATLSRSKDHPITQALLKYRTATKRASTYWAEFISLHVDGKIYPNIRQCGADTFRMSITDPACQTWPDDSLDLGQPFPIRRSVLPSPGNLIASLDYAQMELRLIVDEAEEMGMVRDILQGVDFHQRVADEAKVPRGIAKNARFAKLYGAGVPKVAKTLGVSEDVARRVCQTIDESSPRIKGYSRQLINYTRQNGYLTDWMGGRYFFDPGFEYKAPNYRIQGGCAKILKIAIHEVMKMLKAEAKGNTALILPVHDELVLDLDPVDRHLLKDVKQLMIGAYRDARHLKMDVACAVGKNYHDLEEEPLG